ncbi:MAG: CerR family C-terminal domain-containing protein [Pirellulales bacterium]|nr:CerR family C-terminal domain-containing protein [Pirellulales bacterium]
MDNRIDDTRERLFAAASKIFAEKGFEKTTVREICHAADVSNLAAVNYYFGDKERLYIECVKLAHKVRIDEVPLPIWDNRTLPEQKLYGLVLTMLRRMIGPSQPWHEQLMMREVGNPTTAVAELVQEFIRPHFELLLSVIDELLAEEVTAEKRHLIAFSIVGQCLHYKVARPIIELLVGIEEVAAYTPEQLAEHITNFTLSSLRQSPQTSEKTTPNSTIRPQRQGAST